MYEALRKTESFGAKSLESQEVRLLALQSFTARNVDRDRYTSSVWTGSNTQVQTILEN